MATSAHLKALLKKNLLLWRRSFIGSLLEIAVPIAFSFLLLAFRYAEPLIDVPQITYYPTLTYAFTSPLVNNPLMKNCDMSKKGGGRIALAPEGDPIIIRLKSVFEGFGKSTLLFKDNQAIDEYTQAVDYAIGTRKLCFGVVMEKNNIDNRYQYLIRYNVSNTPGKEDIPTTNARRVDQILEDDFETLYRYTRVGFLTVQNWIDNMILQQETNRPMASISAGVSSVTVPAYTRDNLGSTLSGMVEFFLVMPLLLPFLRLLNGILTEKEKRIREGMKIMGLKNIAFYISWFITYFIIMTVISIGVTLTLRYTFFVKSSVGWLFLWYWSYAVCLVSMAILISVFFNRAKIGNIMGFLIIFLLQFIKQAVGKEQISATAKFWASIAPPSSVALASQQILSLEAAQLGVNAESIDLMYLNYKLTYHFVWMAIDVVAFFLLALYLDQVLPSEFGIRKHPLLCLHRSKKKRARRVSVDLRRETEAEEILQDEGNFEDADPALKIQDTKQESVMIDKLKKIYSNGKLAVDEVSYNMYKGQIFVLLGHNGAGKTSTISMITGLYPPTSGTVNIFGMNIQKDLEEIRKVMGICPQHDVLFDNLTVKEHLEMFATFKGVKRSEIAEEVEKLIVDLDLQEKRHYLAKNLSGGQKRKLSIAIAFIGGSKFIILDEPTSGMDTSARRRLWDMLKNYKHGRVVLLTTHFMDEADYLGDRIGIMGEGKMQCLGSSLFLKNKFGVGYSLTLAKKDDHPSEPIIEFIQRYIPEMKVVSDVASELSVQLPVETMPRFREVFDGLDKNMEKLKIESYGVSVTTLEQVFLKVANILNEQDKVVKKNSFVSKDNEEVHSAKRLKSSWRLSGIQFLALLAKRMHYFKRDKRGILLEVLLPVVMIIVGILLARIQVVPAVVSLPLDDWLYGQSFDVRYNTILQNGESVDAKYISAINQEDAFQMVAVNTGSIADFDANVFANRNVDPISKFNVFFNLINEANYQYQYLTLVDTRAQEAGPFAMNKINQAIIRAATGNDEKEIELIISPFQHDRGFSALENALGGISIAFVFAIGMSFIPASLVTFIVKERELTSKHQQLVSGVSVTAYWLSNYYFDIIKYLIPACLNCLIALAFQTEGLIQGEKYPVLWALFICYGFSLTSSVYLTSFLFKNFGTAQTATFFFHFATGFIGGIVIAILRTIRETNYIAITLQWILRVLPTYSLTSGLLNLTNQEAYQLVEKDPYLRSSWETDLAGGDVYYLAGTGIVYFILIFIVEFFKTRKFFCGRMMSNLKYEAPQYNDSDVEEEARKIQASNDKYSVKVDRIRKVYRLGFNKNKVAVRNISFGIQNGECFALLGVNGAGKTTTFKMLSGDIVQTSGSAAINGYDIPSQLVQAQHDIGYCPQNNPLLENLTATEHLYLYAAIRGIPSNQRKRLVEEQLANLHLTQYADVISGAYSGGTKRKLVMAIALIGNPSVVFLDEPSTGMDPEIRRFMWNVISQISKERKESSVILTTHSMDEAEALATKIGIMVDGSLKCLGSAQHIKAKYGGGYELEIKLNITSKDQIHEKIKALGYNSGTFLTKPQIEKLLKDCDASSLFEEITEKGIGSAIFMELKRGKVGIEFLIDWLLMEINGEKLKRFLEDNFKDTVLIEHFQSFYRFNISSNICIGHVFGTIEDHKMELDIMQYSVKQSSIEQIFNMFATNQMKVRSELEVKNIEQPIQDHPPTLMKQKMFTKSIIDRSIDSEGKQNDFPPQVVVKSINDRTIDSEGKKNDFHLEIRSRYDI